MANGHGGARIGSGRKPDIWHRAFNRALTRAVDEDDLVTLFGSLLARGKSGDTKAASLILAYIVGRPVERQILDLSGRMQHEHREADEEAVLVAADVIRAKRRAMEDSIR